MPCLPFAWPDGTRGMLCTRGRSRRAPVRRCVACHIPQTVATLRLCDWPLDGAHAGQTCDRPACVDHAYHEEPDLDFCPAHARLRQHPALPLEQERL